MKTALYWEKAENGAVKCLLCPHGCVITEGATGRCLARRNVDGVLIAESYGVVTSLALDPIEKKPLYHFHPGRKILSAGSYGCNMSCAFCQNHTISTVQAQGQVIPPEELAELAGEASHRNIGIAFTYNEPFVGYEYVLDCAKLIRQKGQQVVLVTNGLVREEPLLELLEYVDAMNIDLKGFSPEFYRQLGGALETVMRTITLAAARCHVEVTTLIVPGCNDRAGEIEALAKWLSSIRRDIPYHVSRFFPRHKMAEGYPTPVGRVHDLAEVANRHLYHVYTGNC